MVAKEALKASFDLVQELTVAETAKKRNYSTSVMDVLTDQPTDGQTLS